MEGKLVFCFLVIVVIVQVTSQSCPQYFSTRESCPPKRCITNADCSGQVCCRLRRCGRRCVQSETGLIENVENIANLPNESLQSSQDVVHSGRCARYIDCSGKLLCSFDGQCDSTEKCCLGRCGRNVCAGSLRSSIFSYFPGK